MIDFSTGQPSSNLLDRRLLSLVNYKISDADDFFFYTSKKGHKKLRHKYCELFFGTELFNEENIIITHGCLGALCLISDFFKTKIKYCFVRNPTYKEAITIFRHYNFEILPLPENQDGEIDFHALEKLLLNSRECMIYVVPTLNNPDGNCLSEFERKSLAELSISRKLPIIEDDTYTKIVFSNEVLPSIINYAAKISSDHCIINVNSLSKILIPGLRIGFVNAAKEIINALEHFKFDFGTSPFLSHAVTELLSDEHLFHTHLQNLREHLKVRKEILRNELLKYKGFEINDPIGGYFLWIKCNDRHIDTNELLLESKIKGVSFFPGHSFFIEEKVKHIRICYGLVDKEKLIDGANILGQLLQKKINS